MLRAAPYVHIPGRALGNLAPRWPWTINWSSPHADRLIMWLPLRREAIVGNAGDRAALDFAGRGHHGTANNINSTDSAYCDALGTHAPSFDSATPDYYAVADHADLDFGTDVDFTLSAWVRRTDFDGGTHYVALKRRVGSPNEAYGIFHNDVVAHANEHCYGCVFDTGADFITVKSAATYSSDDGWHHVVGGRRNAGDELFFSIDGGATTTDSASTNRNLSVASDNALHIGTNRNASTASSWHGGISDVRLWRRGLNDAEIASLYDPASRFDLYHELGRARWFFPAAAAAATVPPLAFHHRQQIMTA